MPLDDAAAPPPRDPRAAGSILFYVQHLLGIGHLRRALHLVGSLAQAGFAVTLVSGGEPLPELAVTPARRVVQLPPIRARDASFRNLVGTDGRPVDDALRAARTAALLAAFAEAAPDALVIEAYPFGRRALRFELEPLIAAARARQPRPLVLCSLRDIIVAPEQAERQREIVARVQTDFDAVLVHGDPDFIPLAASFPPAAEIADRLIYTGYVMAPDPGSGPQGAGADEVVVSAGGGAGGGALLRAALAARRLGCQADACWRLLAGPNLSAGEFAALAAAIPAGVAVERYRADFSALLRRCRVSVSQAGYNTVLDVLAAGVSAVLVPFADLHETEQSLRAELLAARGAVEVVAAAALSPQTLADAIGRALGRPPTPLGIDLSGAAQTAREIARMLAAHMASETRRKFDMSAGDCRAGK
jgi:predicted glycosyltransferase